MTVFHNTKLRNRKDCKGTFINDFPGFLTIFDLPTNLVLLYNVPFLGLSWTPLPSPMWVPQPCFLCQRFCARESKLSSFHLEFSFNSIRYICLLFYCLVTFGFLWHKFCFKKIHWSDNSLLQVKSTNKKNFCMQHCFYLGCLLEARTPKGLWKSFVPRFFSWIHYLKCKVYGHIIDITLCLH